MPDLPPTEPDSGGHPEEADDVVYEIGPNTAEELSGVRRQMVDRSVANGLPNANRDAMQLVEEFSDIFRLSLDTAPPAKLPAMKLNMKLASHRLERRLAGIIHVKQFLSARTAKSSWTTVWRSAMRAPTRRGSMLPYLSERIPLRFSGLLQSTPVVQISPQSPMIIRCLNLKLNSPECMARLALRTSTLHRLLAGAARR